MLKINRELLIGLFCCVILVSTCFSIFQNLVVIRSRPRQASFHDPIDLNGNTALDNYCAGNGTDGLSWETAHVIKDFEITGGATGLVYASNIHIANTNRYLIIRNCTLSKGVYLEGATHVRVENCTINASTGCAICTNLCSDIILSGDILNGSNYGIWYRDTNATQTLNNTLTNFNVGLWFQQIVVRAADMKNHTISNNSFNHNALTVQLAGNNFTINSNTFVNNTGTEIAIDNARNVTMFSNMMEMGIEFQASLVNSWWDYTAHKISTSNFVGGKPLYYYSNKTGLDASNFTSAGQVWLVNCNDSVVSALNVSGCSQALWIIFSRNLTIKDNRFSSAARAAITLRTVNCTTLSNNTIMASNTGIAISEDSGSNNITRNNITSSMTGIDLIGGGGRCQNNSVSNNTLIANTGNGIYVRDAQLNSIWNNNCSLGGGSGIWLGSFQARNNSFCNNNCTFNNGSGIVLDGGSVGTFCGNNTFEENNCSFNKNYGIFIRVGMNNMLWNNYLANNTVAQAYDGWWSYNTLQNQWDNLTAGNYWGDYQARYPSATNDGAVWNAPYSIGGYSGSADRFPLVIPQPLAISQPLDITYECNTTGHILAWTIVDTMVAGPTYAIYRNGTQLINQTWIPGVPVTINVDGLVIGTYNYTLVAVDGCGEGGEDQVNVTAFNVPPVISDHPTNLNLECNVTGTNIQWVVTDISVYAPTYAVYRNGSVQTNQTWASGAGINYIVEGLPIGDYNFTLVAADGLGGLVVDWVMAFIRNANPTIPSPPVDISYVIGTPGHNITWVIQDQSTFNPTCSIRRDGLELDNRSWGPGVPLVFSIDGLATGDYTFSIIASDGLGGEVQDNVIVHVYIINTAPVLSNPPDLNFNVGTQGYAVVWTISDETTSHPHYVIYQNGEEIASADWTPGQLVVFNLDGLAAGSYNFTLVFSDGLGQVVSDEVDVNVEGGDISWIAFFSLVAIVVIGIFFTGFFIIRKKKGKFRKIQPQLLSHSSHSTGIAVGTTVPEKVEKKRNNGDIKK